MRRYFTDRERGTRTRTVETIDPKVWGGIFALVSSRLIDGSFGHRFPATCPDGNGIIGHDDRILALTIGAELPDLEWPLSTEKTPDAPDILDLLEFVAASIGKPEESYFHSYFRHSHFSYDREAGLSQFINDINLLFSRNGIAYELTDDGTARRVLDREVQKQFFSFEIVTGDSEVDRLLAQARKQIVSPRLQVRKDALEKLWDAFERIKTIEPGKNKQEQANVLLDKVATTKFREMLGEEAHKLTNVGNTFRIRHAETNQEMLTSTEQVDYVFFRMFSFLHFVLRRRRWISRNDK